MFKRISFLVITTVLVAGSCTFDVCSSKRMYVNAFDQFMEKVEKKQDDLTEKQWKEMDEQFERFSGECFQKFEEDLTKKEQKQIIRHNLKYVMIRVKSELPFDLSQEKEDKIDTFLDNLELDDIKVKGEELKKMWKEMDKEQFKQAAEEFGKGFEKLEKAIENLGKELENIFEDTKKDSKN